MSFCLQCLPSPTVLPCVFLKFCTTQILIRHLWAFTIHPAGHNRWLVLLNAHMLDVLSSCHFLSAFFLLHIAFVHLKNILSLFFHLLQLCILLLTLFFTLDLYFYCWMSLICRLTSLDLIFHVYITFSKLIVNYPIADLLILFTSHYK